MSKIPVYVCNGKKCENGSCDLCHSTADVHYAKLDENCKPIVDYYLNEDELPFNYPKFKEEVTG